MFVQHGIPQCIHCPLRSLHLPANVGDIDSTVSLDLHAVLVPCSSHVLIRHLTLEHSLILCLHREVSDALVHLQFFLCTGTEVGNKSEQKSTQGNETPMDGPEFIGPKLDAI